MESSTDIISNDKLSFALFKSISTDNIRPLNTFICRFVDKDILRNIHTEPIERDHDQYIPDGFVEKGYSDAFEIDAPATSGIRQDQLRAFQEMCSFLRQKDIPFILVQAPVSQSLYKAISFTDTFDKIVFGAGRYYNYNQLLSLPDTRFFNIDHMNQQGVAIFDRKFLEGRGF